jgi:opacity protein-like surface antigen
MGDVGVCHQRLTNRKERTMKKFGVVILGFLILVVSAAPVLAKGPYVGLQGGAVFLSDSDVTQVGTTFSGSFDAGYGGSLTGGYNFDMVRLEGELFYKTNSFDEVSAAGASIPADGDLSALGLMVNVYYDFKNTTAFTPFIGVGVGMAKVYIKDLKIGALPIADDDDAVFAYQGIAGVGYAINKVLTLDLAYKYTATADASFTDFTGVPFEAEYKSHNVMAGVRFNF